MAVAETDRVDEFVFRDRSLYVVRTQLRDRLNRYRFATDQTLS